jgi:hypothetical protein
MKIQSFLLSNQFVWRHGGFELIHFTFWFFRTIGICKHTNVASTGDIGLDIIKLEINCNCIMHMYYAFKKPNRFAFFVFKFNVPCGSHFIPYFKK